MEVIVENHIIDLSKVYEISHVFLTEDPSTAEEAHGYVVKMYNNEPSIHVLFPFDKIRKNMRNESIYSDGYPRTALDAARISRGFLVDKLIHYLVKKDKRPTKRILKPKSY